MARGENKTTETSAQARSAKRAERTPQERQLAQGEWLVRRLSHKVNDGLDYTRVTSPEDLLALRSKALWEGYFSTLDPSRRAAEQAVLVRTARLAGQLAEDESLPPFRRGQMKRLADDATELFTLANARWAEKSIGRQVGALESDDKNSSLEVLRQEARIASMATIASYDPDKGASPFTHFKWQLRKQVSEATQEGRFIRMSDHADRLAKRVQAAANNISNEGRTPTLGELSEVLGESPDKIADVLPWVTQSIGRLDAAMGDEDDDFSLAATVADDRPDVDYDLLSQGSRDVVEAALHKLPSPRARRVVELYLNLGDTDAEVAFRDLYDGVYIDSVGLFYSSEPRVLNDPERKARGEKVVAADKKELTRRFEAGELAFMPGTPQCRELTVMDNPAGQALRADEPIRVGQGVPMSRWEAEKDKNAAEELLRQEFARHGVRPRYRGRHELEFSAAARDEVRRALVLIGAVTESEARQLRIPATPEGGPAAGKKSALRKLAEKHGLVDAESGRRNVARLTELGVLDAA